MIRIFIPEINKHRNETTFRPYLNCQDYFYDIGVRFVFDSPKRCDMVWIGQASYIDRTKYYSESVGDGIRFVNQFKEFDVILFDGQDSASLMGSWDVFKGSNALKLLKNTIYKDLNLYKNPHPLGRVYWEDCSDYYVINEPIENVELSGTNWLSTLNIPPNRPTVKKDIDIFAMFQYPGKDNFEFLSKTDEYYTKHRKNFIEILNKLKSRYNIVTAEGGKVPIEKYYELMSRSKYVLAPFGYGEIAPRDIESAYFDSILIKPDMSHISTSPNIYDGNCLYVRWDGSDLEDVLQVNAGHLPTQLFEAYQREYTKENIVNHVYSVINGLDGYSHINE